MPIINCCCKPDSDIPVVCCFIPPETVRFKIPDGPGDDGKGWFKWMGASQGTSGIDVDFHKYIWDDAANGISWATYITYVNPPPGLTQTMFLMHNCTGDTVHVLNGCPSTPTESTYLVGIGVAPTATYLTIPWTVFTAGDGANKWLSSYDLTCTVSTSGQYIYSFDRDPDGHVRFILFNPPVSLTFSIVSPFDVLEMFQEGPFVFDGAAPYAEWENNTTPEWAAARLPAEGCPDYSDLTRYLATPCAGTTGGVKHVVLNDATMDGDVRPGTIGDDIGCWTFELDDTKPDYMPTVAAPVADCEDPACVDAECVPVDGLYLYVVALCADPGTPINWIQSPTLFAIGDVVYDTLAGFPPRYLILSCNDAEGLTQLFDTGGGWSFLSVGC